MANKLPKQSEDNDPVGQRWDYVFGFTERLIRAAEQVALMSVFRYAATVTHNQWVWGIYYVLNLAVFLQWETRLMEGVDRFTETVHSGRRLGKWGFLIAAIILLPVWSFVFGLTLRVVSLLVKAH